MPLHFIRNDITKMPVDAIVNAADESLLGGGGVDGCIHRAAGPELLAECRGLGGCRTPDRGGQAHGSLPAALQVRDPHRRPGLARRRAWRDGNSSSPATGIAFALAKEHGCETVAFPLISSGIFGYPKDQALRVAVDTIGAFLLEHDMTVYLVDF